MRKDRPQTPDGRYFVAARRFAAVHKSVSAGRRRSDARLIKTLMQARMAMRSVRYSGSGTRAAFDRVLIDAAKIAHWAKRGRCGGDDGASQISAGRASDL